MRMVGKNVCIEMDECSGVLPSGLVLPGRVIDGFVMQLGTVIAAPNVYDKRGNFVDVGIHEGDRVVLGKSVGQDIEMHGKKYKLCEVNNIWAVLCEDNVYSVVGSVACQCGAPLMESRRTCKDQYYYKKDKYGVEVPFRCKICGAIKPALRALRDVVILYCIPEIEKIGSIYLPEDDNFVGGNMRQREKKPYAVVLSVGPGYYDFSKKKWVESAAGISVGDMVMYEKRIPKGWSFEHVGVDGKVHKVIVCGCQDIYGVLE